MRQKLLLISILLLGLIMRSDFKFTPEHLKLIRDKPHLLGHLCGKDKLTDIHSKWIKDVWIKGLPIQAHRGSYKTTAITEVGSLWWLLFHPSDRIGIYRKPYTEASNSVRVIKDFFLEECIKALFKYAHGIEPAFKQNREGNIIFNFKKTNTKEGSLNAYNSEKPKTGTHLDKAIIDDFVTWEDRTSKAKRESTKNGLREIITNIMDPGQETGFVGTPWHKNDAWTLIDKPIQKYDISKLNILTKKQIEKKRRTTTNSLFAANYLLKHIAPDDSEFTDPIYGKWDYKIRKVYAQLDAKYSGDHTNGLTFMAPLPDGRIQAVGFVYDKHVDDCLIEILEKYKKYRALRMYNEMNADKGYLAKEMKDRKINVYSYHEKMNKHIKITTYLKKYWTKLVWAEETDTDYMLQVTDYIEGQEPDDCPDSAASLLRQAFETEDDMALWQA